MVRPREFQEVETARFRDSLPMRMVRPALRTGHLCPQEMFLVLISLGGRVDPTAVVPPEGLCTS